MSQTPWYQVGPSEGQWPQAERPRDATPIENPQDEPIAIFLGHDAMESIASEVQLAGSSAVSGILVGHPYSGEQGPFVVVTDCIFLPGDGVNQDLTSEALERLHTVWQAQTPGMVVVGWFHASKRQEQHITAAERFTHERHFPRAWQIALLIDSGRDTSTLYRWEKDRVVECSGFYYFDSQPIDVLQPARAAAVATALSQVAITEKPERQPTRRKRAFPWSLVFILLLIYFFIPGAPGGWGWLSRTIADESSELISIREDLHRLQAESEYLESLRAENEGHPQQNASSDPTAAPVADSSGTGPSGPSGTVSESSAQSRTSTGTRSDVENAASIASDTASLSLPDPTATGATDTATGGITLQTADGESYVIQPGDTMWQISERLIGDPNAYRGLAEINQIENPDIIYPGQMIKKE